MNMYHFSHFAIPSTMKLALLSFLVGAAACASRPPAPPVSEAPPAAAFVQASTGVAEQQASPDDIVFVETEHKEPVTHEGAAPATRLRAEESARRQHLSHLTAPQ